MDRPTAAHAPRSRRLRKIALALGAIAAAAAALVVSGERPAQASSPLTLKTITVDGSFSDWDAVLANAAQATHDGDGSSTAIKANCGLYSTDRDCPMAGGAGNDFLTFAWTYDASNVYLYIERYGSTTNGVDLFFVADVNRDKRLTLANDAIVHATWFGGTGRVDLDVWSYQPADAFNGDPIVCTPVAPATACANAAGVLAAPPGYVDGYKLPGTNVSKRTCTGCAGKGGADGTRAELAIPWSVFGATPAQPFFWHVVSSNNGSLTSAVDNIGAPDGGLGSFVQRGVSLYPDRSGSVPSPGQVTYVHTLRNDGNDVDVFDLSATSSEGAMIELLDAGTVIATDLTGDGTWDSILAGRDQDGDGRPDVTLAAGASHDLSVRITMPSGRSGDDTTRLTAASGNAATVSATATDTSHLGAAGFVPASQAAYTVPSQALPFRESLANGEAAADTFELRDDGGCAGFRVELARDSGGSPGAVFAVDANGDGTWDTVLADSDGDGQPDLGPIAAGASQAFHLLVTPPAGSTGTSCTVALTATSPTTQATARATHSVSVVAPVTFGPDARGATAGAADGADTRIPTGASVFFPAVIRNAEATARSYALSSVQTGGGGLATAPRVWSDPNGDGNPSDGAVITQTDVLSAFGGAQHVLVEVGAGTAPTGAFLVTTTTATATSGGASASQVSEGIVGYLAAFADALHADAANVFAPCATVYLEARGLLAGDVGTYALAWAPPYGPAPAGVSPWPTNARGTADAQLALAADAALGPWSARLLQSGALKDQAPFQVVLPSSAPAISTDRARYLAGDAVTVTASVTNDAGAPLDGTSLAYSGATSRVRTGVSFASGATVNDAFTFTLPSDAAPGTRSVVLGWQLGCATAPFRTATATFDVAPPPPAVTAPPAGAVLADATPAISGTALPGATVVVTVTDPLGTRTSPALVAGAGGTWSWSVPVASALSDGSHQVRATQTVNGVDSAASAAVAFQVDTVPPAAPSIASPANGTITRAAAVAVAGTAADPGSVSVEVGVDGTPVATVPVVAGAFSATVTLADGARVLTARALDAAGNVSAPSASVTITVDTVPPAKPALALAVPSPTRAQPVPLSGTAEPLASVDVLEAGTVLATVQAGSGGAFSAAPTLGEGAHALVARATDAAGNVGPSSDPVSFLVDRTAPPVPLLSAPADGAVLGIAAAPGGQVPVSGAAEAGATVELEVSGVPYPAAVAGPGGTFVTTLGLADGSLTIRARAIDAAGNASAWSTPSAFTLDTAPPGQPFLSSPADGASLAALTIRVEGVVDADAVAVDLLEGGIAVATAAPSALGVAFDLSRPEGTYAWTLVARDAAGNASLASNTVTVTVDRTAPAPATVISPAAGAIVSAAGGVVFAGTAEPGATVAVSIDGGAPVTVRVAADGTWSVSAPAADGLRSASIVVVDAAGNASGAVGVTFTADAIAPAAPVLTAPASGATNASSVTVSGTAEDGATVHILVNGVEAATATASGGAFSAPAALPASDGTATITAIAVDAAGNASPGSAPVVLQVDRTAPNAPTFSVPALTNLALVPVSGTAEPGATVEVLDGGVVVATTTAGPDGAFSVGAPLGPGTRSVSVSVRDAAGNATVAGPVTVVVDRVAPDAPAVTAPADGALLGIADLVNSQVICAGTAEAGALVELELDGAPAGGVAAGADGTWSLPLSAATGAHVVRARATDAAGNASPLSNAVAFTVDATLPLTPTLTTPAGPLATNALDLIVAGTAEPNVTIRIRFGGAVVAELAADGAGAFSASVALPLADGTVVLTAVAVDAGGNVSPPTAPLSIAVDRTAPAAPVVSSPAAGAYVASTSVLVAGTAEPGATVRVTAASGATVDVVAKADGTFQATLALANGAQTVTVRATDAAGNFSEVTRSFNVDTVAPAAPTITAPSDGTVTAAADLAISGTAPSDAVLVRILDGGVLAGTALPSGGAFTATLAPAEGAHAYTAVAVDAAGNASAPSAPVAVTVDRTAPPAPTLAAPATPTRAAEIAFTGTAERGATVEIVEAGAVVGSGLADASTGAFSIAVALPEGSHVLAARARDAAGNVGAASSGVTVVVDRTAPAAPAFTAPAPLVGAAGLVAGKVVVSGTAEADAAISVEVGGLVTPVTAAADGSWSISVALGDGAYDVHATATDAAGNVSAVATRSFTLDTAAPAVPLLGAPSAGPTRAAEVSVAGTAEPGATVRILVNGSEVGTAVAAAGTGAFSATVPLPASDGDAAITVVAVDAAGNASAASTAIVLAVDRTPPGAPALVAPASPTNAARIALAGTAEPGATVEIVEAGAVVGTGAADATSGAFSISLALAEGDHVLAARARDAAGNVGPSSATVAVTVDRTAPPAPVLTAPSALVGAAGLVGGKVVVSGTAEANASVSVDVSGVVTLVTAAADGGWSLSLALADGAYVVRATARDAAGNVSPEATRSFALDTVPPAAPVLTAPAGGWTNLARAAVVGTAEPNATIQIRLDGSAVAEVAADASGTFSTSVALPGADGPVSFSAVARDAAGNASGPSAQVLLTVDRTAPAAPALAAPASPTRAALVAFTGTAEPGTTVELGDGGAVVGSGTAASSGAFSISVALSEGVHDVAARARDAAGNVGGASPAVSVVVDRTAPLAPVVTAPGALVGAAGLVAGGVVVSGTAEPLATVSVDVGGVVTPVGAGADGAWSVSVALADGAWVVRATAADAAGNVSPEATRSFTLDTAAPAAPVLAAPAAGPTNATQVSVAGTAEPGATVHVLVGGVEVATATAAAGTGAFAVTVALPAGDGAAPITATAEDAAGNASVASAAVALTVDRTAPAAPVVDAPANGAVVPPGDVVLSGHAEPGALVTIAGGTAPVTATAAGDGAWSATLTLAAGPYTLSATATDAAGNLSAATQVSVTARADGGAAGGGGGGCGCRSTGGATGPLALLALLALAPRRRRAR
ncbi:MAG TPA: Ig-like domain-containing protein [Anaeromyxobacter sp.]